MYSTSPSFFVDVPLRLLDSALTSLEGLAELDVFDMARVDDSMITPSRDPRSHTPHPPPQVTPGSKKAIFAQRDGTLAERSLRKGERLQVCGKMYVVANWAELDDEITFAEPFALEDGETEEVLFEAGANGVSELGMSLEEAVAATGDVEPADVDPADSSCSESESDGEPIQFDNMDGDTVIDATEVRARLKQLKVVELKSELRAHGLPVSGRKADLVERLVSALFEDEEH